ncbi:MAG: SPFH domain-containing protein [Phycisphaerae bacterium]|nr:SPFH domain-containing protein [Phycisphaerae bacterium]
MSQSVPPELEAVRRVLKSNSIWLGLALLLILIVLLSVLRIGRVSGEQVGILLDRITGKTTVINQSGVRIYNGMLSKFYVLDKTLQTLEMTEEVGRGDRRGKDDLKIKTVDGSDVYVDLKVQYRIDPDMAEVIIASSGPDENYKMKWARDYVRSICRNRLGELSTEQFYDSSKRAARIVLARNEANEELQPFGIIIDSITIPRRPHFYREYEEMIKKKKLADQGVLQEQSMALAAKQKQLTLIVQETNKKNVAVEEFEGEMRQLIIAAEAEAEKTKRRGDAYYDRVSIGAAATLYRLTKEAAGVLVLKSKEAEGIKVLRKALEGEGGRNMVKLEYARKLKGVKITGKPFTIQNTIDRFEHLKAPATTGRE